MRRFFFLSLFLHGIALLLLFSWEIPEAGKLTARNIIQVSLIETAEEETPAPKAEKAAEKPKAEKRIAKKAPPSLPELKETAKEIAEEDSKEEKIQRVEEPRVEPASPLNKSAPFPSPLTTEPPQPSGTRTVGNAKGAGEENIRPGAQEGGGAFMAVSLNPDAGKEGIPSGGGDQQARVRGGDGGTSERKATGSYLSEVDPTLLQIMRRIEEAKRYPNAARRMGIEGKTVVRFKLKPGGEVEAVEVAESSGSEILDKASVETVREAAPLPYKAGWLKVGIVFKIL